MAKKPQTGAKTKKDTAASSKQPSAKRGLGRGLSSLLGDAAVAATARPAETKLQGDTPTREMQSISGSSGATDRTVGYSEIPVEWINSGPWQPRRKFDQAALAELADSIRSKGVVQPILVRPSLKSPSRFELIAGERRWRAAQMAQIHQIPAVIREFSDEDAFEIALIENIQRADLTVIEEAEGYRQLIESFGYRQEDLAEAIGKSRSHIANLMRLLSLPSEVMDLLNEGTLSMGQARPLIGRDDAVALASEIVKRGLTVREVEAFVSKPGKSEKTSGKPEKSVDIRDLEDRIQRQIGLKVDIDWDDSKGRGRLTMNFKSLEQFDGVMDQLGLS